MRRLFTTAKLKGIEPLAWLTDLLERMVSRRNEAHGLERLLPWNQQAERLGAGDDRPGVLAPLDCL
jgi:hypothetical protein